MIHKTIRIAFMFQEMLTINLLQHYKLDGNPINKNLKRNRGATRNLSFSAAFKNQLAAIRLNKSIS